MTKTIATLLIANRGEIAVRIIRACKELGIRSVAVYSQADSGALHTRMADKSVEIGPAEVNESYLSVKSILSAAKQTDADAIHPGYGFLAENADFAQAVMDAGLIWIGPAPAAMRVMGNKAGARALMEEINVPVLPGYQGSDNPIEIKKAAAKLGYPVLVKAAAGGGGLGQRIVNHQEELETANEASRRDAKTFFGNERLILEKYLPQARHVEVQVLGDESGNLVHLFERECSLQRRRQKIVEESPSPFLDDDLRSRMCKAALSAAEAVNYTNAGTVEFLVDEEARQFYFLEMNTRIQVEHPVTEVITGIDLVQWQIRIAKGEPLTFRQQDLKQHGHAIECRVYAEDPADEFLPQAGRVLKLLLPNGDGIRVDTGVTEGDEVGTYYDPMLAKLIVWGNDRQEALEKTRKSLASTAFLGITTNTNFLQDLLGREEIARGEYDTQYIESKFSQWNDEELPDEVLIAAAFSELNLSSRDEEEGVDIYSPWANANGFRVGQK